MNDEDRLFVACAIVLAVMLSLLGVKSCSGPEPAPADDISEQSSSMSGIGNQ